jgi:hypothetical protein
MTESKEYEHPFPNTMFSFLGAVLSACHNSHRLSCKEEEGEKSEINRGSHSGAQLIKIKKTPEPKPQLLPPVCLSQHPE